MACLLVESILALSVSERRLNHFQDGGIKKPPPPTPPTSFFPVTSTNVEISPQNVLLVLIFLSQWCKFSRSYLLSVQVIEPEPRVPLKKIVFSGQVLIKLRL